MTKETETKRYTRLSFGTPSDPWGHDYVYEFDGRPVVKSLGRNGTPGGEDLDADLSPRELQHPAFADGDDRIINCRVVLDVLLVGVFRADVGFGLAV